MKYLFSHFYFILSPRVWVSGDWVIIVGKVKVNTGAVVKGISRFFVGGGGLNRNFTKHKQFIYSTFLPCDEEEVFFGEGVQTWYSLPG